MRAKHAAQLCITFEALAEAVVGVSGLGADEIRHRKPREHESHLRSDLCRELNLRTDLRSIAEIDDTLAREDSREGDAERSSARRQSWRGSDRKNAGGADGRAAEARMTRGVAYDSSHAVEVTRGELKRRESHILSGLTRRPSIAPSQQHFHLLDRVSHHRDNAT